jgi:hypothetical protein
MRSRTGRISLHMTSNLASLPHEPGEVLSLELSMDCLSIGRDDSPLLGASDRQVRQRISCVT